MKHFEMGFGNFMTGFSWFMTGKPVYLSSNMPKFLQDGGGGLFKDIFPQFVSWTADVARSNEVQFSRWEQTMDAQGRVTALYVTDSDDTTDGSDKLIPTLSRRTVSVSVKPGDTNIVLTDPMGRQWNILRFGYMLPPSKLTKALESGQYVSPFADQ